MTTCLRGTARDGGSRHICKPVWRGGIDVATGRIENPISGYEPVGPMLVDIQVHNGVEVVNDGVVSQPTGDLTKNHIYASDIVQAV
jgi:hypothetical protein